MRAEVWCSEETCFMQATVLISGVPYCTADGRDANGGSL